MYIHYISKTYHIYNNILHIYIYILENIKIMIYKISTHINSKISYIQRLYFNQFIQIKNTISHIYIYINKIICMIKHKSVIKYHVYNIICVRKIISQKQIYIYIQIYKQCSTFVTKMTQKPLNIRSDRLWPEHRTFLAQEAWRHFTKPRCPGRVPMYCRLLRSQIMIPQAEAPFQV